MNAPVLMMRKKVLNVQGRMRPCIQIQARVAPDMAAILMAQYSNEPLFKRTFFQAGLPAGTTPPSPSLAPHLGSFLKSDGCPEIAVKTLLGGQSFQATGAWEVPSFEFVAKWAFDALLELMATVSEMGTETYYAPGGVDLAALSETLSAERTARIAAATVDAELPQAA